MTDTTDTQVIIEGVGIVNVSSAGGRIEVTICDTQNETVYQSLATESDLTYSFRHEVKRLLGVIDYAIIDGELLLHMYREGLSPEQAVEKYYSVNKVNTDELRHVPSIILSDYTLSRSLVRPYIPLTNEQVVGLTTGTRQADFNGIFANNSNVYFKLTQIDNKPVLAMFNKDTIAYIQRQ